MKNSLREVVSLAFRLRGRRPSVVMLLWGNWILLGVSWGMSVRAYLGLHGRMALWSSLWTQPVFVGKSWLFFFYPAVQLAVFMAGLSVGRNLFIKAADTSDLASLKSEISYLELIFINILFIHLQTGLILVSFGLGRGVNKSYMAIIAAVIVMLVPYYHIRRRILHR